jgi:hypothetical protein
MKRPIDRCIPLLGLLACCTVQSAAQAAVATFESLSEGF